MRKFKAGEKAIINSDEYDGWGDDFAKGSVITIRKHDPDDRDYLCVGYNVDDIYIAERHLKPIKKTLRKYLKNLSSSEDIGLKVLTIFIIGMALGMIIMGVLEYGWKEDTGIYSGN